MFRRQGVGIRSHAKFKVAIKTDCTAAIGLLPCQLAAVLSFNIHTQASRQAGQQQTTAFASVCMCVSSGGVGCVKGNDGLRHSPTKGYQTCWLKKYGSGGVSFALYFSFTGGEIGSDSIYHCPFRLLNTTSLGKKT